MKSLARALPMVIFLGALLAFIVHGPVAQFEHYHEFADQHTWLGIPHAMDVLSNIAFALVAVAGLGMLTGSLRLPAPGLARPAYLAFFLSLAVTAFCSAYYHLAPDDARLFWDRLPIALACCSLLAAIRAENLPGMDARRVLMELGLLLMAGLLSVIWWQRTGDLRPYLLIQVLTLVLVPLWQWIGKADARARYLFGATMLLYAAAKLAELFDAAIMLHLHIISGHSVKHLLAALAAALIALHLRQQDRGMLPASFQLQKIEVYKQTAS